MKLLFVTTTNDKQIAINVAHIVAIEAEDEVTIIITTKGIYSTDEMAEDIIKRLEA